MKNKLISMVDRVLNWEYDPTKSVDSQYFNKFRDYEKYATFLNTPLNLSMFVPAIKVGDIWEVLEEPNMRDYAEPDKIVLECSHNRYLIDCEQYQKAKDNVIFEGWTLANETQSVWAVYDSENRLAFIKENGECLDEKTIQDLIKYNPTLTKKGLEVSGLNNK